MSGSTGNELVLFHRLFHEVVAAEKPVNTRLSGVSGNKGTTFYICK